MYSLSQLRCGIRNPRLFFREANRLYHTRANIRLFNTEGVDVFAEGWDNLLILDGERRKNVAENPVTTDDEVVDELLQERLQNLG